MCEYLCIRFPLYWKGTERALFHYAVHLLNKDIGQVRTYVCVYICSSLYRMYVSMLHAYVDGRIDSYNLIIIVCVCVRLPYLHC